MRDEQAKRERGYKEKNSIVRPDGSEKLVGRDWQLRKAELWRRCGGICERIVGVSDTKPQLPVRCKAEAEDPHHIKPRSKGRDDRISNLEALCRRHHEMLDWKKVYWRPNHAA